jgi:uncharacterized protein YqeY
MTLVEQVNRDFVAAFKAKDAIKKSALSVLKSKLTDATKTKKEDLTDQEAIKIIVSNIKQRSQSIAEFEKAGRTDLVDQEKAELAALEAYLPIQLSRDEIVVAVNEILEGFASESNPQKKTGMTIGVFNKKYAGQFDQKELSEIIKDCING